jgi:hypothetical protein
MIFFNLLRAEPGESSVTALLVTDLRGPDFPGNRNLERDTGFQCFQRLRPVRDALVMLANGVESADSPEGQGRRGFALFCLPPPLAPLSA